MKGTIAHSGRHGKHRKVDDSVPILCWGVAGCVGKRAGWCYSRFPWLLLMKGQQPSSFARSNA